MNGVNRQSRKFRFGAYLKRVIAKSFDLVMRLISCRCILQTPRIRIGVAKGKVAIFRKTHKPPAKIRTDQQTIHSFLPLIETRKENTHAYDYNERWNGDLLQRLGQGSAHRI